MINFGVQLEGVQNIATGLNPGSITGFFGAMDLGPAWIFVKIFAYFAIFVLGSIILYKKYFQYNIAVTLKSRMGGGAVEIRKDRAKLVTDDQTKTKLQLQKLRNGKLFITCPEPGGRFKSSVKGMFGRTDHYEFWLDDNKQLHPIEPPAIHTGTLKQNPDQHVATKMRPQERQAWARWEAKNLEEKYKQRDLLKEYLPAGILIVAMITAFLIWFFATKELGNGLVAMSGELRQIAASCTSIG